MLFGQNSFTITFNANGGSGTVPSIQNVPAGTGISLPDGNSLIAEIDFAIFGGWNTSSDGSGRNFSSGSPFMPTENVTLYAQWNILQDIDAKINWLHVNSRSNRNYTIEVRDNFTSQHWTHEAVPVQMNLVFGGRDNITITFRGVGADRVISLPRLDWGEMFRIGPGVTLVLDGNITLQGNRMGTSLINIMRDGSLIINEGTTITGHGGAALVIQGTFTMNGGTILDNNGSGNFNDTFNSNGGGVTVFQGGTFIMNGGSITGNIGDEGGGVRVAGSFTMNGGTISGNQATRNGGGVFVATSGIFNKTGGIVTGYFNDSVNGNAVINQDRRGRRTGIQSNMGHAVFINDNLRRETTSGMGDNMMFDGNNGTFAGAWDF